MDSSAIWIIILFSLGYLGIIFEHVIKVDKAAIALVTGVGCWLLFFNIGTPHAKEVEALSHHLSEIAAVLFFLISAMLIVEVIDAHHGFESVGALLQIKSKTTLFWVALVVTFFMSSVLDNLTTIIVMITLYKS